MDRLIPQHRLPFAIASAIATAAVLGLFIAISLAVHQLSLFELDISTSTTTCAPLAQPCGNANTADSGAAGDDWANVYAGTSSAFVTSFIGYPDEKTGSAEVSFYTGGGSKDVRDIPSWKWDNTNDPIPNKDDISDAFAAGYINPANGHTIFYFGMDRFDNNGDAEAGFWFFRTPVTLNGPAAHGGGNVFNGTHANGDILVLANWGGSNPVGEITVYQWIGGTNPLLLVADNLAADCAIVSGTDNVCAVANRTADNPDWSFTDFSGSTDIRPLELFEAGIDLNALFPGGDVGCFSSFLAATRSSHSTSAQLKDFALGSFPLCDIEVTKTGDTLSKVGDPVDYTVTIHNTGHTTLFKDDISDSLLGDIAVNGTNVDPNGYVLSNNCGASLTKDDNAAGGTDECTITLRRTVQGGDPDPLPNTVTIVYREHVDFTGQAFNRTASHEVNLFQPSIDLEKTGPELSKVGDEVTYTVTIENTSSSDSPDLVFDAITDTLQGDLTNAANYDTSDCGASLAPGDTCTIVYTYTVLETDDDPLLNTAAVESHPDGFTNDIDDSDDWSVELFQPSVAVDKTCDPTLLRIGQTVTFTCTVTNTSSSDTPDLIFDYLSDTLDQPAPAPDVDLTAAATTAMNASACTVLSYNEVCSFSYVFVPTVVGIHTNTVEVHYNPDGFQNDVWDDGQCTFEAQGGEGCTPGFFKRWTNVWDEASDAISVAVKAAVDAKGAPYSYTAGQGVTTQLFRNIFGLTSAQMIAAGYSADMTMLQAINANGGGFNKLARHAVAGLLSSASVAYPYTTDTVLTMVHNAVVSLAAEPTAQQLADANNLTHQNCPTS